MFDGLFSPTRLDGGMTFVPTEGGTPSKRADGPHNGFQSPDVAYGYREQCDDDTYLVVTPSPIRFGSTPVKRMAQLCREGWAACARRMRSIMR